MLKERRHAVDTVAAHFLKAEAAADEAAMLTSECVSTFMRQRLAAKLPLATGLDALQLLSDAAADLVRARQRMVEAHRALFDTKGAIGLRGYGAEGCPPASIDEHPAVMLAAVA
ncbi:hypothetical protein [Sphingomonas bacterium]|uniref:hypothetical protein n=1 Tax=Sphingomonas bacterium TaxID=1895847 RepID=UPI001576777B|nr:hypothetical protein [Sphingomonas bacterium]